jgi:hypothetical protein
MVSMLPLNEVDWILAKVQHANHYTTDTVLVNKCFTYPGNLCQYPVYLIQWEHANHYTTDTVLVNKFFIFW